MQSEILTRGRTIAAYLLLAMMLGCGGESAPAQGVVINEILADNRTGLRDEDGAASDWIELYNSSDAAVSLAGYSLSDQESEAPGWLLPERVLPAHGYQVIFASNKDRRDPAGTLHADFALRKDGEYLALRKQGIVVSSFVPGYPKQQEDVSYGYSGNGEGEVIFMNHPTPGAANDASGSRPAPVLILPESRLFQDSVEVTLTGTTAGRVIHYTMDGSQPDGNSPVYEAPLTITTTAQIRAVAKEGDRLSGMRSMSWIKIAPDLAAWNSPLPMMVIENFGAGKVPSKGFPTQDGSHTFQVERQGAWWMVRNSGGAWNQRDGSSETAGNIGIRRRGSLSSTWVQKGYSVQSQDGSGKGEDSSPGGLPENDDWVLYYPDPTLGELRDPTMISNTFIYELSRRMGRWAPRFRFVELFLNEDGGDLKLADRRGVYVLLEKISRGKQRLDFSRLSVDGLRGGALLSVDRMDSVPVGGFPAENGTMGPQFFFTAGPDRIFQTAPNVAVHAGDDLPAYNRTFFNFAQPGGYEILTAQRSALEEWFSGFEQSLYDPVNWRDAANGWRKWLVEDDWALGYLMHNFVRHTDALKLSVYPWLGDDRRLRMGPVWDVTPGGYFAQGAPDSSLFYRGTELWLGRLFEDPDFRQTYIDQWARMRRTGFSDASMDSLIDNQAAQITEAKAVAQGVASPAEWHSRLTALKTWVKGRAAYFDASFPALPKVTPAGGMVAAGSAVTVQSATPEVWVTLDGSDPRLPGGAVSPKALPGGNVEISQDIRVTARSRNGLEWSAPVSVVFAVGAVAASPENLVISEIHYHPGEVTAGEIAAGFADREALEFLELHNPGAEKVSLHDVRLVLDEEQYEAAWSGTTADQWTLPPDGRLVLVRDRAAFARRYPAAGPVGGVFSGQLPNDGGTLRLRHEDGTLVGQVEYRTRDEWPEAADGAGYSLTRSQPGAGLISAEWRSSVEKGGSPGTSDAVIYSGGTDPAAWREYAFGQNPQLSLTVLADEARLELVVPPGRDRARSFVEWSVNLNSWETLTALVPVESRTASGGFVLTWMRLPINQFRFLRARAVPFPAGS